MGLSVDYIIVGQGIAGSILACELSEKNVNFFVVNKVRDVFSSKVAAGIWNPINFRRMIFGWNAKTFIQYNASFYRSIEEERSVRFYFPKKYFKIFNSYEEQNLWMVRSAEPNYSEYLNPKLLSPESIQEIEAPFGLGELYNAGYMDTNVFLNTIRNSLIEKKVLLEVEEDLVHKHIDFENKKISIEGKEIKFEKIIFAEGFFAQPNGLFFQAPFKSVKGEVLSLHVPDLNYDVIFNKSCFTCAVGENIFNIGSNYDWSNLNHQPTPEARKMLVSKFQEFCKLDFEVVDHRAAVRPASIDRRPFMGEHPHYPNAYIFNGLGSKGVMIAPYMARVFAAYLEGETLANELNIARFAKYFSAS